VRSLVVKIIKTYSKMFARNWGEEEMGTVAYQCRVSGLQNENQSCGIAW
jgi:hypothetical protein